MFVLVLLYTSTHKGLSQENNLGIPRVHNYSKEEYKGGTQNWEADYLSSGKVLFANNDGLLIFNGNDWSMLQTPKRTLLRSLEIQESTDRFWVGGQDEIGYFYLENGRFEYEDQKHLIPDEHKSLDDIWEIVSGNEDDIYFISRNKIFRIHNGKCSVFSPGSYITFLQNINGEIYSYVGNLGLIRLNGVEHEVVKGGELLKEMSVVKMLVLDADTSLIMTFNNGIYKLENGEISRFKTNVESYLDQFNILTAHYLEKEEKILIGTEAGGLIALGKDGAAQFILDKKYGLQNNTVSSICADNNGNVWLGTYNGIDKVDLASASTLTYPDGDLEGAIYDIEEWKGAFYFATSNGLYTAEKKSYYNPTEQNIYTKISSTEGQCWGLNVIDDRLYLGHTLGAFEVLENGTTQQLSEIFGAWKFVKMDDFTMIVGTYYGIELYRKKNGNWVYSHRLEGFNESSRIMFRDIKQNIWISHPYKGLFRMRFSEDFETMQVDTINDDYGLTDLSNCYVHEIEGVPLVSTNDGLFMFDYGKERYIPADQMNELFEGQSFKRIFDTDRGIWYITDQETGLLLKNLKGLNRTFEKRTYLKEKIPYVGGFEFLYPLSNSELLIATDKGVQHNVFKEDPPSEPLVQINSVQIASHKKDSIVYQGFKDLPESLAIDYEFHDVRFDFVSDRMEPDELSIQYSYMLEGYDEQWSEWTAQRYKEYTNLPSGSYTFHVKCSTYANAESRATSFSFEVNNPWYSTTFMKLVYMLLGLLGLYMLILLPNRKIKKEKEIIEIQKNETEAILENLENESLQKEIKYQNQELANLTMHLLQKSETLKQIRTEVENVRKKIKDPDAKKEIRKVVSLINSDNRLEEDWNNFSYHFDKVHHDFLKRIREEYPKLTANDLKLCAYLRLNLSTKEIAPLLNISTRGIEISRYRLRKKLALTSDVNLNNFMMDY